MPVSARYQSDPEKYKAERRASYRRTRVQNRDKDVATSHRAYHESGKWKLREKKYGITKEQFEQRLADQGDACAICHTTEPGGRGDWHTDHNHKTGRIRGILCHGCNIGLGMFREEVAFMKAAIEYMNADRLAEDQRGSQAP